jgi:drug/metabolite transporter (DMT)-like permease
VLTYWLQIFLLASFWGGSYLAIRFVIEGAPPLSGALVRILICSLLVTSLLLLRRRQQPVPWKTKAGSMLVGILLMGLPWALLFWAEQVVIPSLAALLMAALPIFTLLFAPLVTPTERPAMNQWIGIGIGFFGIFLLILPSWQGPDPSQIVGILALLVVAASYGTGTLGVRRLSHLPIDLNLFYQSIGAALFLIPLVLFQEEFAPWDWSRKVWWALLYLGVCSTFIAWLVYFRLVRVYGSVMASVVPYFAPVVSLILDRLVLKTLPHFISIVGGIVILIGVYVTQRVSRTTQLH